MTSYANKGSQKQIVDGGTDEKDRASRESGKDRQTNSNSNSENKEVGAGSEHTAPTNGSSQNKHDIASTGSSNNKSTSNRPAVLIRNKDSITVEPEVAQRFDVGDMLGTGAYGTVFAAVDKLTQRQVAIKIIAKARLGPEGQRRVEREVAIMASMDHPRILRMICFIPTDAHYNIVLEKVDGGELFTHLIKIQRYTERKACRIVMNVLRALRHMHAKGFMHSDLKPENLLLVKPPTVDIEVTSIKLADFGLAQEVSPPHNAPTKCCGSPLYIAPEVLEVGFQRTRPFYDTQADMWSLGVVTYLLLSGLIPFYGSTPNEIFKATLRTEHNFNNPIWQQVSDVAKDFINRLFVKAPEDRMSAEEALAHPWMDMCADPDDADDVELSESLEGIRRFNASQKLRGAVYGMEAAFRMAYMAGCEQRKIKANSRLVELLTSTTESVSKVDLSNNYLGTNGLRALSEALVNNSRVTSLNLTNVLLDDQQLETLMEDFLRPKCRLHTLFLNDNNLSHKSGRLLLDLARMKSQYIHISARGCHIKDRIISKIEEQCASNLARAQRKGTLLLPGGGAFVVEDEQRPR